MKVNSKFLHSRIRPLKEAIESFEAGNPMMSELFLYSVILKECKELLNKESYSVVKLPERVNRVTNYNDLINMYYIALHSVGIVVPYRDNKKDAAIAKRFVEKIKETTGFSQAEALNRAAQIVDAFFITGVFREIDLHVVQSFSVFGQDKMAWITEEVVRRMNKETQEQAAAIAKADEDTLKYEKKYNVKHGWEDLDELTKNM